MDISTNMNAEERFDIEESKNIKDYTLSVDKNDLIVFYGNKKYICKNSVYSKTKKTKRLLYALKGNANLSLSASIVPSKKHIIYLMIKHPLYDDEIYKMIDEAFCLENNDKKNIENDININTSSNPNSKKILNYIYVLELEQNKYYVGKSSKPLNRTGEHIASTLFNDVSSSGSGWTRMYTPNKILEVHTSYDEFDEDLYTLRYMKNHGIDNVRGGSFCELNLSQNNIVTLEKMLAGANDRCYYCGSPDHYVNACPQKNIRRVTKKHKEKSLKLSNLPKARIANYFGMTKLLQNSKLNLNIDNVNKSNIDGTNNENVSDSDRSNNMRSDNVRSDNVRSDNVRSDNVRSDNVKSDNVRNDDTRNDKQTQTFQCKYCDKIYDSQQKVRTHENMMCTKNKRVAMRKKVEADVDEILEKNKHLLENKSRNKNK
jgi:hypothetical protein